MRRPDRLRLLLVIDNLGSGGAQRQLVALARGLAERGHRPVVCVYYPEHDFFGESLASAGIEVRAIPKSSRFSLSPAVAMRRMLRAESFDAIVAYLPTPAVYAELAAMFPGRPPLVVSERTTFNGAAPALAVKLRTHLHRVADAVVTNSHHHRRTLEQFFPWIGPRMHTIWNGVDLEWFAPAPTNAATGAHAGDLLAVGTVRPLKNPSGLAAALARLNEEGRFVPRVRWAGKVEATDASRLERGRVDELLARHGLTDRWEWLGETGDVRHLMQTHAALIHPSLLEGLSNAVCEALACGLPVVAGAFGDQPLLVQDGTTGFLFDPGSVDGMADAISRFYATTEATRSGMGAAARRFAVTHLSLQRVCDEYESLLSPLVERHRIRRGRSPAASIDRTSLAVHHE